jgi:hypothetical protein
MEALRALVPTFASPVVSTARFPDGADLRVEIPSVEGPRVLEAVLEEAARHAVVVNRISQGSGAMLLTTAELRDMAEIGHDAGIEVCLFTGPRASWDIGVLPHVAGGHEAAVRGSRQLGHAVADIIRATAVGIRAFLVGDIGLLSVLRSLQESGDIPADCAWKVSAYLGVFNPATARVLADLGATTINVAADLSTTELAELRAAVDVPLDLYVEAPDGMGGTVRTAELAELVRAGAPLHAKFGLRNAPAVYPAGLHIEAAATLMAREKVRRAAVALEWLADQHPAAVQSKPHAPGLAVPCP